MKRFLKWFMGLSILLVVVIVGLIYVGVNYVKSPKFKQDIITEVKQSTGRDITIDGGLDISFYPWAGINLQQITVSNPEGFSDEAFLKADLLAIRIKTWPLLQQQFELDTLKIHGLQLHLEKNKQGISNWSDLIDDTDETNSHDSESYNLAALIIGGIDIKDSQVTWNDQVSGQTIRVNNINANTGELSFGEPIDLLAGLTVEANQPALYSDVKLNGVLEYDANNEIYKAKPFKVLASLEGNNIPDGKTELMLNTGLVVDLNQQTATIDALNLKALDSELNATLTAHNIESSPVMDGQFELNGKSLALICKVFEIEPLASQLAKQTSTSFNMNTSFALDMQKQTVTIPDFVMSGLGTDIKANVKTSHSKSSSTVAGQVNAKGDNLPMLLEIIGHVQADEEWLAFAQQLSNSKQQAFDMSSTFDLNPAAGKFDVSELDIKALGLSANGHMNSSSELVDGQFTLKGEQLSDLLTALGQIEIADVLKTVDLQVGVRGEGDEISLSPFDVRAVLENKGIADSLVDLVMTGDIKANTQQQTASLNNISIQGLGLDLKGNLNMTELDKMANFNGDVSIAPFDLRAFLTTLNQTIPETADDQVLKQFSMQTGLSGSKDSLSLSNLKIVLDDSELQGEVSVENFSQPAIGFGLNINQLNMDRYLPANNTPNITPESAAAGAATELPMETLRSLNVNGDLTIGHLIYSNISMDNVVINLKANEGELQFNPAQANLYEGQYSGDIVLDATGKQPKLSMQTHFKDILVEPLLTDLSGEATISGKGNVSFQLTSLGADVDSLRNSLNGTAQLALENGILKGVDVPKILHDVEVKIENKDVFGLKNVPQGGETPFESVTGTLQIKNGLIMNQDLALRAPGFEMTGQGMVMNMRDQTWKYDLEVEATEQRLEQDGQSYNLGGHRIPIRCRGFLADKNCIPDAGKIISALASRQVERKLSDFIGQLTAKEQPADVDASTKTNDEVNPTEKSKSVAQDPVDTLKEKAIEKLFKGFGF